MFKHVLLQAGALTLALTSLANAEEPMRDAPMLSASRASVAQPKADRPGPTESFLTEISAWLVANFGLTAAHEHPKIVFVSKVKLATMRRQDQLLSEGSFRQTDVSSPVETAGQRDVVALYDNAQRTIVLSDDWDGSTPAQQSVLVHEMVHHLQNVGNIRFECPMAREKTAYVAQDEWLKRFGTSLETEFDVDMFTVLISSACMY